MKKSILILISISALIIGGCDKVTKYHNTKSYKIYTSIDDDLSNDNFCKRRESKGVILINDTLVAGEIQNKLSNTVLYLSGELDNDTNDLTLEIIDTNMTIGIAEGRLNGKSGSGTWASDNCYGKWQAIRED